MNALLTMVPAVACVLAFWFSIQWKRQGDMLSAIWWILVAILNAIFLLGFLLGSHPE